ncbi:class A beta-lactamase-related serine hydrolase [Puteibacter caeruleilacunae]|nr:class A beta-lactamase-related serine hydrolase [Puteibacter caeruleilacunae]
MKTYKLILLIWFPVLIFNGCNHKPEVNQSISAIDFQIDSLRVKFNIPAVAYGVIKNDTVLLQHAIGYRDIETKEKAQVNDLFHIGSNTKAFTSFLAAKLVEQGVINWDTRFFDVYPELKNESKSEYAAISLKQLLGNRARLISFQNESEKYPIADYEKNISPDLSLPEKRYAFIKQVLQYEPIPWYDHPDDRYSNAGFIAAALMLEKASGKTWEELFLKMSDDLNLGAQIGWPDDNDPEQPKGHINPKAWTFDINKDIIPLPEFLKKYHYFNQFMLLNHPSGNVSISLPNFLEYLRLNIRGLNGEDNYLQATTYNDVFNGYSDYSCGWMHENYFVPCFHHKGSSGTFNSIAIIEPNKRVGIVILINVANADAINALAKLLINKYVTEAHS